MCFTLCGAQYISGNIEFLDGRVETVKFDLPLQVAPKMVNYQKVQYKIRYVDPYGRKKEVLPTQAKRIVFIEGRDTVKLHSVPNNMGLRNGFKKVERLFLRLELDGELKLYRFYSLSTSPGMHNAVTGVTNSNYSFPLESFILHKENTWLQLKRESYMADMQRLLWSCPNVSSHLAYRNLTARQIAQVVQEYNSSCGD